MSTSRVWLLCVAAVVVCLAAAVPAGATLPGRSGLIAFQGDDCGRRGIFTIRPDGERLRRVSRGGCRGENAVAPAWSPRGRQILYFQHQGIVVSRADGSGRRSFALDPPYYPYGASWSPDGSEFAWFFPTGDFGEVFIGPLRDPRRRFLTQGQSPSWSPDGRSIALVVPDETDDCAVAIAIVDAQTGARRRTLLAGATNDGSCHEPRGVDWSPDGRRLVYTGAPPGGAFSTDVWVIRTDGRARKRLTSRKRFEGDAVWSPDGRWIAYERGGNLALIRPDGTHDHFVTVGVNSIAWQPLPRADP